MGSSSKKIIVVSSNHKIKNEAEIFTELFKEGTTHLHVRKHGYPKQRVKDLINKIPSEYHKQIVLHSHLELCKEFDLGGIHITRKKRKDWIFHLFTLLKYKNRENFIISTSYHSSGKIERAANYYTYFFLNSLFGSIRTGGEHSYKDPEKLKEFLRATSKDVVALGGIDMINIHSVREIGFKSVGLHGALWGFDDPIDRFKSLRDAFLQ